MDEHAQQVVGECFCVDLHVVDNDEDDKKGAYSCAVGDLRARSQALCQQVWAAMNDAMSVKSKCKWQTVWSRVSNEVSSDGSSDKAVV